MKVLHRWDTALSQWLGLSADDKGWPIAVFLAHVGDGYWVLSALIIGLGASWLTGQGRLTFMIAVVFLTLLVTAFLVFIIKYWLRRERPRDPTGFVAMNYDKHSFPSGHSARMSCLAATIFFYNRPLGLVFMVVAILVALARVQVRVHYLGDVLAGLLLGIVTAVSLMLGLDLS